MSENGSYYAVIMFEHCPQCDSYLYWKPYSGYCDRCRCSISENPLPVPWTPKWIRRILGIILGFGVYIVAAIVSIDLLKDFFGSSFLRNWPASFVVLGTS